MSKRTFASVTEVPCTCRYLEDSARNPNLPVKFKPELNEYHIESRDPQGAAVSVVVYHCPFCGGAAPESQRNRLFAVVSDEEAQRLHSLVQKVKTVHDASRILGTPDIDQAVHVHQGVALQHIKRDGITSEPLRTLTFTQLSTVADLQVTVYSNDEVEVAIFGKYLGAAKSDPSGDKLSPTT